MFAVLSSARKAMLGVLAVVSMLLVAACQPGTMGAGGVGGLRINPDAPVAVALLVPRGSGQGGDETLSTALENAARLAISDLDGVNIDLRVYGTAGDAAQAQQSALQAVSDGAKIILGPVYAESANAVAVAVAPKGVNVLSFSNNTTIAGGNLFILGPTFENTADRLVRYISQMGKSNILVVSSDDVSGQLGSLAIQEAINSTGGVTLAGQVSHEFSQQGVVGAVPQIKDVYTDSAADTIFLTANSAGALPLFSQLLPEAGVNPQDAQYVGLSRWDIPPQTLDLPGLDGGWFALPDPQKSALFRNRYEAATGTLPHPIGGLAYDAIAAVGALVKAGKADALTVGALTQGAGFEGTGGIFRLRVDGTNERGLAVATIKDKQVVVIDPAPRTFGGIGF